MVRHWAEVGFRNAGRIALVFYVVKILLYVLVSWLIVLTTTGINGFAGVMSGYSEPTVFQKVVCYAMLF